MLNINLSLGMLFIDTELFANTNIITEVSNWEKTKHSEKKT